MNKVFLLASLLVMGAFSFLSVNQAHAQLDSGLVSYWNFDDNLADSGGVNTNDLTYMGSGGGPNFTISQFGTGLLLNGNDEHAEVAHNSSLEFGTNDQVSISAWARVDAFDTSWQALVSKGEGNNFRIARRGGSNARVGYAGGLGDTPDVGAYNVNDGQFHHIVAVTDDTNGTFLYIDGVLQAQTAGNAEITDDASNPLMWGENPDAGGREWEGVIDDAAIWNRPLTQEEITQIFQGGQGGQSLGALIAPAAVPEPASVAIWLLLGVIAGGLGWRRLRRR